MDIKMEFEKAKFISRVQRRAIEIIVNRFSQLNNAERLEIVEMHQPWRQQQYSSDAFVQHGMDSVTNRPALYRARRNVAANALPPDVNGNDWLKI